MCWLADMERLRCVLMILFHVFKGVSLCNVAMLPTSGNEQIGRTLYLKAQQPCSSQGKVWQQD